MEQRLLLMLTVNVEEQRRKITQRGYRCGLVIDVDAIPFIGGNLPANDDIASFGIQPQALQSICQVCFENGFHNGSSFTGADHFSGSFGSSEESKCINDDGFSGACLAGKKIEAFFEVELKLINKSEISDAKKPQHTRAFISHRGLIFQ